MLLKTRITNKTALFLPLPRLGKLGRSLSFKRKARFAPRLAPEVVSRGALKWNVSVVDEGVEKPCYLAISPNQIVIVEQKTKVRGE